MVESLIHTGNLADVCVCVCVCTCACMCMYMFVCWVLFSDSYSRLSQFDVVITTYGVVGSEGAAYLPV